MKQHADYLPCTHHKTGDQVTAILFDDAVDCEADNQHNIDEEIECFELFHNCIF